VRCRRERGIGVAALHRPGEGDVGVDVGVEPRCAGPRRELGLDDRITWRPLLPQAELAVLYREATALVIPAVEEGLGLTAVEALLSETPVVAFASGGVTDAVVHEETGLLVRPGDAAALAAALDDLMTRPDRGAALGRAGRRRVLNTFSMEAVGKRYAELYRAALVAPRR